MDHLSIKDTAVFNSHLKKYYPKVFNYIAYLFHNRDLAEEATQEAFLKAWKSFQKFDQTRSFLSWIVSISRNQAIDILRKSKKQINELPPKYQDEENLLDKMTEQEEQKRVLKLIRVLPEIQQSAILLYYFETFSIEEIGFVLKKSKRAVISLLHRARTSLKEKI